MSLPPATAPEPPSPEPPDPERLGPTTMRQAAVAVMAGAVVGYFVVATMVSRGITVPVTPWSLAIALALLGALGLLYSRLLRRQVATARGDITPEAGLRALVLGKTMLMGGAALLGGHLLYVLSFIHQWDVPTPRERIVHGLVAVLASALFAVAGREVERSCLVDPGEDDPDDQGED